MGAQDKIERILKQIHVALAEGETVPGNGDKVTVDKKEVLDILEQLNLAIYEIMDQYEVTSQARELAERRSEKKGEEMIARITSQAEDIYAASLMYTDEALSKLQHFMAETIASNQQIWHKFNLELEQEKRRMQEDQLELRGQLQDFKDSNKYLVMIEDCNRERERQEKDVKTPEKRIQNEAKHYAMNVKPEIKVNPAYFERRGIEMPSDIEDTVPDKSVNQSETDYTAPQKDVNISGKSNALPQQEFDTSEKHFTLPEIKVDLDAEYFKWQAEEASGKEGTDKEESEETGSKGLIRKEWKSLFGKRN